MTYKLKLDIISDVVCPWCLIGYHRMVKAIFEMGIQNMVCLEWHPFQLNSHMPAEGEEIHAHLARKYGMSREESNQTLAQMTTLGAELDFTFDFFDGFRMVNTCDLHILLDFAKISDTQTELKLRLFEALFSERRNVSDRKILTQELQKVGLNTSEGLARLDDSTSRDHVLAQEEHWKKKGISAVPTMIFNNSHSVTGAQPVSVYKHVLSSFLQGEPLKTLGGAG